ncbi:unnamed protein product, partial [Cladocopium goreaui]
MATSNPRTWIKGPAPCGKVESLCPMLDANCEFALLFPPAVGNRRLEICQQSILVCRTPEEIELMHLALPLFSCRAEFESGLPGSEASHKIFTASVGNYGSLEPATLGLFPEELDEGRRGGTKALASDKQISRRKGKLDVFQEVSNRVGKTYMLLKRKTQGAAAFAFALEAARLQASVAICVLQVPNEMWKDLGSNNGCTGACRSVVK